jgi:hypothetical protein
MCPEAWAVIGPAVKQAFEAGLLPDRMYGNWPMVSSQNETLADSYVRMRREARQKPREKIKKKIAYKPREKINDCACGCGKKTANKWLPGHNTIHRVRMSMPANTLYA